MRGGARVPVLPLVILPPYAHLSTRHPWDRVYALVWYRVLSITDAWHPVAPSLRSTSSEVRVCKSTPRHNGVMPCYGVARHPSLQHPLFTYLDRSDAAHS
ncbi:hypothetical protein LZ30DRAFT_739125 [Colletotrichum cereale]|nr:hypothetical protein LZ30DRAFT_739125 [Colletotrichum cereale]